MYRHVDRGTSEYKNFELKISTPYCIDFDKIIFSYETVYQRVVQIGYRISYVIENCQLLNSINQHLS